MSKHTPGPWAVDANVVIGPPNSGHEIEYDGVDHAVVAIRETLDPVRWEHDARLIAAAPTMLRVLEDFATAKPEDLATLLMTKLNAMNIVTMLKGVEEDEDE